MVTEEQLRALNEALDDLKEKGFESGTPSIYDNIPEDVLEPFKSIFPEIVSLGGDRLRSYLQKMGDIE